MIKMLHSGGAKGADLAFQQLALDAGYTVLAHSFYGHIANNPCRIEHSQEELLLADTFLLLANKTLKRTFPTSSSYVNNLLRRNYFQVKDVEQVIAVSRMSDGQVEGGTAWATQMAVDANKQVFVYDMRTNQWFFWNSSLYVESEAPSMQDQFAGIGSRDITPKGLQEIQKLFAANKGDQ